MNQLLIKKPNKKGLLAYSKKYKMASFEDEWLSGMTSSDAKASNRSKSAKGKGKKKGKSAKSSGKGEVRNGDVGVEEEDEAVVLARAADAIPNQTVQEKLQGALDKYKEKDHDFWSTQPMPSIAETFEGKIGDAGPIDKETDVAKVQKENLDMPEGFIPAGFEWCDVDVKDEKEVGQLYKLLNENYVEDDDSHFRFDYSVAFIQWALTVPDYIKDWHVGIRHKLTGELYAFISGIPADIRIHTATEKMVEINFLCIHKKLRSKRLAPILIKEITRRVNARGIWQAVYTAGVVLPKPVARCRYWHRSINSKKLIEVGFSRLHPRMTMTGTIKKFKLPERTSFPLQRLTEADLDSAHSLLSKYLKKTKLCHVMTKEEMAHQLLPREKVVDCYILKDSTGKVTDMISFYHLPSTVLSCEKHNHLEVAYSYYNVATTVPLVKLMKDLLVIARNVNVDVVNALELMDNESIFEELQFKQGDGFLQYYIYNWRCAALDTKEVGLVLL